MKKYLFLFVSILSIFFITDSANALSFTAPNGVEIEVDSEEKLLDYCYYTYIKGTEYENNDFALHKHSSGYIRFVVNTTLGEFVFTGSNFRLYLKDDSNILETLYYNFLSKSTGITFLNSSTSSNSTCTTVLYSTSDVYSDYTFDNVVFSSNVSKEDIENKYGVKNKYIITYYLNDEIYKTIEVEEGTSHELLSYDYNDNTHVFSGWQYDENIDLNNITSNIEIKATLTEKDVIPVYIEFPIDKTEFYVLLVEVGVLIMIIFLKWCFPFKGGTDLK